MNGQQSQSHKDIAETAETNKKYGETLVEIIDIGNSPFNYVKSGAKGFLALGRHNVMDCELDEAIKLVNEKDWEVLFNSVIILIDSYNSLNNK